MLRLTTFGGLALSTDGVPMTGAAAQRSRLALLALLASAGTAGISRDKLLLYLWPESDSERARNRLKQAVYSLRRDLGNDEAIVGTTTLALNAAVVESDLWDFEQAIARGDDPAAATAYAGPFLDGVYLKEAPEFERWTAEERARLAHDWCSAVERLAGRAEAAGEWREAIAWRRQLAAAEPLSGRVAIALMRALAESGDVGAALQHFRVHETLVREELEAAPEADVASLADAMRSGSWERRAPVVRPAPPVATPPALAPPAVVALAAPEVPPSPVASEPSREGPVSVRSGPSRVRRRVTIGLAVVGAALAAAVVWYVRLPYEQRSIVVRFLTRPAVPVRPGLYVVAPLENKTGDTTLDAFGELAADEVIAALDRAKVEVVPATTASLTSQILQQKSPAVLRPTELGIAVAKEHGASTAVIGSYYRSGDTMQVALHFIDMATRKEGASFRPVEGVVKGPDHLGVFPLAEKLGRATLARMALAADTTAEGRTVALVPANSLPAFSDVARAYGLFFDDPTDTVRLFSLLARAEAADPDYTAGSLLRAYVLDVKRLWPATEETVRKLRPLAPRLNGVERSFLDLYEADLRGDPYGRLLAARSIMQQTPSATEWALLVTLSALYVGRPNEALAAVKTADPDHGMNLVSPVYWEWRAEAEHEAGQWAAEAYSAKEGMRRFDRRSPSIQTMARVLATAGGDRLSELNALFAGGLPDDTNPRLARLDLMVTSAHELRHHGSPAAANTILAQVAAEQAGLSAAAPRTERYLQATVLYDLAQYDKAKAILTVLAKDSTDLAAKGRLGAIAMRTADPAGAARIDAQLAAITTPYLVGDATTWRAHIAAAGGRIDDAVALLRIAVRHGYRLMDLSPDTVHLDRDFVELSQSPAYRQLQEELARASVQ